jgi:hypothetical protein
MNCGRVDLPAASCFSRQLLLKLAAASQTAAGWLQAAAATDAGVPAGGGGAGGFRPVLRPLAALRPAASGGLPLAGKHCGASMLVQSPERELAPARKELPRGCWELTPIIRSCSSCSYAQRCPPPGAGALIPLRAGPDARLLGAERLGAVRCGRQVRVYRARS